MRSMVAASPAGTTTSWPAMAAAGAPNTGQAMKEAPWEASWLWILREVSGCTVEQSTMILEERESVGRPEIMASRAASSPTQMKIMVESEMAEERVVLTVALLAGRVDAKVVALLVVRL